MLCNYVTITNTSREDVINAAIALNNKEFDQLPEAVNDQEDLNLFINRKNRSFFFIDTPTLEQLKFVVAIKNKEEIKEIVFNAIEKDFLTENNF
jgi:hypothetical protein